MQEYVALLNTSKSKQMKIIVYGEFIDESEEIVAGLKTKNPPFSDERQDDVVSIRKKFFMLYV